MANEVLLKGGNQIVFADHLTDFSGGAAKTSLTVTASTQDVQIDTTSVADGATQESAKADLGATRPERYSVMAAFEFAATPVTGDVVELYWAPSPESVAANGNPMSIDGVDGLSPSGDGTVDELIKLCQFIGVFTCTNDPTGVVQIGFVGIFSPSERYGMLLIKNESGAAFHSAADETHVVFTPIITEVQ